jgi:hypothetical protein
VGLGSLAIIRLKCAFRHGLFLLSTARKTTRVGALRIVHLNYVISIAKAPCGVLNRT